ncbi:hypothetical protein Tbis_3499 [Thermobispora bispora DSM 43833]|jgi:hypothetical protein|uniref:Uncharacterized protein n=1 Tax=Thermobispora bispora (strain ATCC 19993 / DSM 43833 / CBS 139.67 / JCM 10125 / KCTC 9307 / NBRC 14880 / R51) TaxID=469371 RepID=D6YAD4_THEBD|nr:hypothetical protein Tbis_3499 [Thermobispora bispora DSM 43833]
MILESVNRTPKAACRAQARTVKPKAATWPPPSSLGEIRPDFREEANR